MMQTYCPGPFVIELVPNGVTPDMGTKPCTLNPVVDIIGVEEMMFIECEVVPFV